MVQVALGKPEWAPSIPNRFQSGPKQSQMGLRRTQDTTNPPRMMGQKVDCLPIATARGGAVILVQWRRLLGDNRLVSAQHIASLERFL